MNTNFENIPDAIFDWLDTVEFSQLSAVQQKEVLAHFSKEEYDGMHVAATELKAASAFKRQQKNDSKKSQLLERFDAQQDKKVIPLFSKPVIAWQAASVLLFLLAGWLLFKVVDFKKESGIKQMAGIDTVFVDRAVASTPEIIHDTVYLYKQQEQENKAGHGNGKEAVVSRMEEEPMELSDSDMYVMPVNDSSVNEPRGNSMRDDSLLRKYGFISM